jgi:hypothetical protein
MNIVGKKKEFQRIDNVNYGAMKIKEEEQKLEAEKIIPKSLPKKEEVKIIFKPKTIDSLLLFAIGFFSFYFGVEFFYRLPSLYFNLFFYGGIAVMFLSVVWYLIAKKRRQNVQKNG